MKTKILAIGLFLLMGIGASAAESTNVNPNVRAVELIDRVQQIRTMDFNEMNPAEKAELKSEIREIRSEMKELRSNKGLDDKVSISIGAIIIILLLLILL